MSYLESPRQVWDSGLPNLLGVLLPVVRYYEHGDYLVKRRTQ